MMVLLSGASPARAGDIFAGADLGTMGLGLNLGYQVSNLFKIRLNGNFFPNGGLFKWAGDKAADRLKSDDRFDAVSIDITAHQYNLGLLADVHPFAGRFRISGGLYYLRNDLKATAKARAGRTEITFGDKTYTISDIPENPYFTPGDLSDQYNIGWAEMEIKWKKIAPYLGIGWGTEEGRHSAFNFSTSLGIIFSKPTIDITPHYHQSTPQVFRDEVQRNIDKERDDMDSYVKWLSYYPVISMGFTYRF